MLLSFFCFDFFCILTKVFSYIAEQNHSSTDIPLNKIWNQHGSIIAGGNGKGNGSNQLSAPSGICVDTDDQTVYIADTGNDRIIKWEYNATYGKVVAGGNRKGNQIDQLNGPKVVIIDKNDDSLVICDYGNKRIVRWPRENGAVGQTIIDDISCTGLAIDNNGDLYVSDDKYHTVRRWKKGEINGTIVAGKNGQGVDLNQLNSPNTIFVDQNYSIYVSDTRNNRVMKWMKSAAEGIVVAGRYDKENDLAELSSPVGMTVDHFGNIYVVDARNRRIMYWSPYATEGKIAVAANEKEAHSKHLSNPFGLALDRQYNLYVSDFWNDRVQKFCIVSDGN
ncbi:unnamed protein product [Adineta ricciae]|uniref:Uncharacterized protein n=1 Tax=Adineta ricciae TaxID=249248 RepID=A0A814RMX9_ADIRI|nr:unnamed protein product [Adineta ricciae]